jgi:NADH-quinone oxidoreductase subunit D
MLTKNDANKEVVDHMGDEDHLTTLNLGPTHPATHGVFQNIL